MRACEPIAAAWRADLDLGFSRRGHGTVLSRRIHSGPLRVQKPLYPEGLEVCHAIVLHPPAGIAGGDELRIDASVDEGAKALLTTPGAAKWYRSNGAWATQQLHFNVAADAVLEWLPQSAIVYSGARASMGIEVKLAAGGLFIGWETLCFGRAASGERFDRGDLRFSTRVDTHDARLWLERGHVEGDSPLLSSPVGLAGHSVCATMLVAGRDIAPALLAECRTATAAEGDALFGLTALPRLLVARYLGDSAESAQDWLIALWRRVRPALIGREAQSPRIWKT